MASMMSSTRSKANSVAVASMNSVIATGLKTKVCRTLKPVDAPKFTAAPAALVAAVCAPVAVLLTGGRAALPASPAAFAPSAAAFCHSAPVGILGLMLPVPNQPWAKP